MSSRRKITRCRRSLIPLRIIPLRRILILVRVIPLSPPSKGETSKQRYEKSTSPFQGGLRGMTRVQYR